MRMYSNFEDYDSSTIELSIKILYFICLISFLRSSDVWDISYFW